MYMNMHTYFPSRACADMDMDDQDEALQAPVVDSANTDVDELSARIAALECLASSGCAYICVCIMVIDTYTYMQGLVQGCMEPSMTTFTIGGMCAG